MIFEKYILNMYKDMLFKRCEDEGTAYYFSAADFPGLHVQPYTFTASAGHTLQGYLYRYDTPKSNRLVVFDHGFGGGHRSYMKEIELLCRHGYRVFAYDHTGCMESGGEHPNGLAQSLCDLNDCITAIKKDPRFMGLKISVVGHSWGGFATANIAALHPEIAHVVVLSGFVSVEEMVNTFFSGLLKFYRKPIMALERASNPVFAEYHAVKSLSQAKTKALLIYSDNDEQCKSNHYHMLRDGLADCGHVRMLLVSGKHHNPNYTADAVEYLEAYSARVKKLKKKKKLDTAEEKAAFVASFDWNRMTAQDETVWAEIFNTLDN